MNDRQGAIRTVEPFEQFAHPVEALLSLAVGNPDAPLVVDAAEQEVERLATASGRVGGRGHAAGMLAGMKRSTREYTGPQERPPTETEDPN